MRDPNFYDYGEEDWSGYAKRKALKPFAETLLSSVNKVTKAQSKKVILDDEVYYKLEGPPTKIHGMTIYSVLFNSDFSEIIIAGQTFKR